MATYNLLAETTNRRVVLSRHTMRRLRMDQVDLHKLDFGGSTRSQDRRSMPRVASTRHVHHPRLPSPSCAIAVSGKVVARTRSKGARTDSLQRKV